MHSVANRYTSSPEQRRMGGYKGAKPDRNFRIQQRYSASHRCDHFNTVKDQLSLVSINTDTGEVRQHCNRQLCRFVATYGYQNCSRLFTETNHSI